MNEETIRISPKGFMRVQLMDKLNEEEFQRLWDDFEKFVRDDGIANGMDEGGIPCLVFKDGGHSITVESAMK